MNLRGKFSALPPTDFTEGDLTVLAGFIHSHGYQLLMDEMQRYAISLEIEVFAAELTSDRATLERVYQARAAWMCIERIQRRIEEAIAHTQEKRERERPKTEEELRDFRNAQILGNE